MYTEEQVKQMIQSVIKRAYCEGFEDAEKLIRGNRSVNKQQKDNSPGITINLTINNNYNKEQ